MVDTLLDWLHLLFRWAHVIAGVMWIGQTYLFNRLERELEPSKKENIMGEIWMVHGGGFYLVEKQKWPEIMPRNLMWFKWESALTWISGFLLLAVFYWTGAPLLDYGSDLSQGAGIAISVASLIGGWVIYDLLWRTPISKHEKWGALLCWLLAIGAAWALSHWLSWRAVYLHMGAIFGTIMVCNVWMRILPNQRKMIEITKAGGKPQYHLATQSARCSRHNTFMSVPVMFFMISNHYPALTFGCELNLAILAAIIPLGWVGAYFIRKYA